MVCGLDHLRLRRGAAVFARDQGSQSGRAGCGFSVSGRKQVAHGLKEIPYLPNKYALRRKVASGLLIDFDVAHDEDNGIDVLVEREMEGWN